MEVFLLYINLTKAVVFLKSMTGNTQTTIDKFKSMIPNVKVVSMRDFVAGYAFTKHNWDGRMDKRGVTLLERIRELNRNFDPEYLDVIIMARRFLDDPIKTGVLLIDLDDVNFDYDSLIKEQAEDGYPMFVLDIDNSECFYTVGKDINSCKSEKEIELPILLSFCNWKRRY